MKYQIIGKNITVTDAIKNAIEKKLGRMSKYFVEKDEVLCRALVRSYPVGAKVEITIFTSTMDIRAEEKDEDLYAAVDKAVDTLVGQVEKLKARVHRRNKVSLAKSINLVDILEDKEQKDEKVVRTKSIFLEPMDLDEAITRMEALGHNFFMYLDADDNMISILYHRNDGGYGIIEAENIIA